jgi:hypothetical protein
MVRDWNRRAIDTASRLRWRPGTIERSPLQLEGDYPKRALADASVYCPILVVRLLKTAWRMMVCCGALRRLWSADCYNSRLSSSLQVIFSGCLVFWRSLPRWFGLVRRCRRFSAALLVVSAIRRNMNTDGCSGNFLRADHFRRQTPLLSATGALSRVLEH